MPHHILITGASGMIGSLILAKCLKSDAVDRVTSLVRRKSGTSHEKLNEVVIEDFLHLDESAPYFNSVDIVFYCLGVYTGTVDKNQFRMITVDYPETLARALVKNNPRLRFCLLSGSGADRTEKSRVMFARDKGAIENRLAGMGLGAFHTFQPGYIFPVTPRREPNFSYELMRLLHPLIRLLGKGASVKSTELADVMFEIGINGSDSEIIGNRETRNRAIELAKTG